jgi:ribosomal protein S25
VVYQGINMPTPRISLTNLHGRGRIQNYEKHRRGAVQLRRSYNSNRNPLS